MLTCRLLFDRSILKNYRARTEPLFPASHEQVHLSVLSLVMSGTEQKAVLVTRLAAILLPCYLMAEISALLEFLHIVSLQSEPKLKTGQVCGVVACTVVRYCICYLS